MKANEIKVGGLYRAKVAGKLTTVRVDLIRDSSFGVRWDVTNMVTGRRTTFKSAAKFRSAAKPERAAFPDAQDTEDKAVALAKAGRFDLAKQLLRNDEFGKALTIAGLIPDEEDRLPEVPFDEVRDLTHEELAADAGRTEGEQGSDPMGIIPCGAQNAEPSVHVPTSVADAFTAVATTAPVRKLTDEQAAIIDAAPHEQVLVIEAGAGCGKTSTMVEAAGAMRGHGQYTAFNTSLVAESKAKFPDHCPCNTIHALGYRSEGYKFRHRLNARRVMGSEVAAMIGLTDMVVAGVDGKEKRLNAGLLASQVTKAVRKFCQSADREVGLGHFGPVAGVATSDTLRVQAHLLPFAMTMWEDMSRRDGTLPFTHDAYVKVWQLGNPVISADYVLLDEAQDTSPVMLDVLAQQVRRGTRVILVGDSAQQIYSWRGAVNALAAFPDAKRLMLSQSFRFGQVIAEVANAVLGHLRDKSPLVMRGFDQVRSRLGELRNPHAVLCRTNAAAVQTLLSAIAAGKHPHLIGGGDETLKFVNAARDLQQGKRTQHPELESFDSWGEVKTYSATDEGEDLKLMVKLVDQFGAQKIADALRRMPAEADADLVVSTAHKSKGREWDTVRLANDFMPLSKMGDEELRLLYVAATRARQVLDVETCAPFCGDKKDYKKEGTDDEGREYVNERRTRVIDLREARRMSKEISDELVAVTTVDAPAETTQPVVEQKHGVTDNTWTKGRNGEWCVRGKPGQSGTVEVVRKNGNKSRAKLGRVIWQDAEVALYAVEGGK